MQTYVIYKNTYNDDANSVYPCLVKVVRSDSEAKVESLIKNLTEAERARYALMKECSDFESELLTQLNEERKEDLNLHLKSVPKWPSGLRKHQITEEMRAERKAVEDFNNEAYKRLFQVRLEISSALQEKCIEKMKEMGLPEDQYGDYFQNYYFDYNYEIKFWHHKVEVETL